MHHRGVADYRCVESRATAGTYGSSGELQRGTTSVQVNQKKFLLSVEWTNYQKASLPLVETLWTKPGGLTSDPREDLISDLIHHLGQVPL